MLLAKTHPVARGKKLGQNQPPQWQAVPTPSFVYGAASNYPPTGTYQSNGYVTDADGNQITITWLTGSVSGVTWDGGKFVYDGVGAVSTTGSLVLRADDGTDTTDSSSFSIEIASGLAWSSTPAPSFVEASVTPFNLGAYITNYNSATDEFRVTPGYSLPTWLTLTGTGSVNLTPDGTQVDADDVASSPGIALDVRRSGGAWVSSAAFGVTVTEALPTGPFDVWVTDIKRIQDVDSTYWNAAAGTDVSGYTFPPYGKHMRAARRSSNGKYYIFRIDLNTGYGFPLGTEVQELMGVQEFDPATNSATLVYPWTGYAGDVQPIGNDSGLYVWDSTRDCGWMLPNNNYTGATGTTWPGPSTWGNVNAGLYKFSHNGTRWQWALDTPTASLVNWAAGAHNNAGCYDPANDSIYFWGDSYGSYNGFARLYLPTKTVYRVTITLPSGGVPITGLDAASAQPYFGGEDAVYGVFDPVGRKLYLLDLLTFGTPYGSPVVPATSQGRHAGVLWQIDLSSVPATGNTSAPARVWYTLPTRFRRPIWHTGENRERSNLSEYQFDGRMELWAARNVVVLPLPPQTTNTEISPNTTFVGGEQGFTEGTETPSLLISTQTSETASEGPPLPPMSVSTLYGAGTRKQTYLFVDEATNRVAMGWKNTSFSPMQYYQHRGFTYPSWRPSTENVLTEIGANTLYSRTPFAVGDVQFVWNWGNSNAILTSWTSAVFSPYYGTHGAYLVFGGGDGDRTGNEVYVFSLDDATWRRYGPWGPGASSNVLGLTGTLATDEASGAYQTTYGETANVGATGIGQPLAPHTYATICVIPPSMGGGSMGSIVTPHGRYTYGPTRNTQMAHKWDIAANTSGFSQGWNQGNPGWTRALSSATGGNTESATVVDPDTSTVWCIPHQDGQFTTTLKKLVFNATTGMATVSTVSTPSHVSFKDYPPAVFWGGLLGDKKYAVMVGATTDPYSSPTIRIYDLSVDPVQSYTPSMQGEGGASDIPTIGRDASGLCYCPDLNVTGGGVFFLKSSSYNSGTYDPQAIFKLTPPSAAPLTGTWTWKKYTPTGATQHQEGGVNGPITWTNGLFNRLQYIRSAQCVIMAIGSSSSGKMYAWVPPGLA